MQMRPEIQIASAIKAMNDVVIPAIDPANKLAVEQSQLIIGLLSLLRSQLPLQFRFDRDELGRLRGCVQLLSEISATDAGVQAALQQLAASNHAAAAVLEHCTVDPAELTDSVRALREAMGKVVSTAARTNDLAVQLRIEKLILDMSKEQLLRDRALMKIQGWEMDPAALPDIEALLGQEPVSRD